MIMSEVADLNSAAIFMLLNKKYESALNLFSKAITNLQQQQQQQQQQHEFLNQQTYTNLVVLGGTSTSSVNSDDDSYNSVSSYSFYNYKWIVPLRIPVICNDEASSPNNDFIFYKNIFYISPITTNNDNNYYIVDQNEYSSILMTLYFNIASTYHRMGLEGNKVFLMKALEYYNTIFSLSKRIDETKMDMVHKSGITILLMAVITNVGHIHSHYCKKWEVTRCQTFLACLIQDNAQARFLMDDEEFINFFLNSSHFSNATKTNCVQGAAAA